MSEELLQFHNCRILRDHRIINEDLWVRNGKIINHEKIFFDEKIRADRRIDCQNRIISPGLIDIQLNGGFGIDFSNFDGEIEEAIDLVALKLLPYGTTAFCPTLVTSPENVYHKILPRIQKKAGGKHGATVLGVHVEGPFISPEKKGAHPLEHIKNLENGFETIRKVYGCLDNVKIITLAPELDNVGDAIEKLSQDLDITVSLGHSSGDLRVGEEAVNKGATLITHLFNAMLPFHHRDPGLVGLLASQNIPENKTVYFGIISDNIHTHPAALRIAYRVHPDGLVLVTDAISAFGLNEGKHNLGQLQIEIRDCKAFIAGTNTLCGSVASLLECVKLFRQSTGCSLEYALEAASLHPARALGLERSKGTLNFGGDADFILLNDDVSLESTWIAGECVYRT